MHTLEQHVENAHRAMQAGRTTQAFDHLSHAQVHPGAASHQALRDAWTHLRSIIPRTETNTTLGDHMQTPQGLSVQTPPPGYPQWYTTGDSNQPYAPYAGYGAMSPGFLTFGRFGAVDNAILVASALLGFGLDKLILDKIKVPKGYGPIVGMTVANAISNGVAGLSDSKKAAAGVFLGSLLPLAPVAVAIGMKKPLKGTTAYIVGGSSALLLALILGKKLLG